MNIDIVVEGFKKFKEVEGILLAGSQVTDFTDNHSDADIYIYLKEDLSVNKRREFIQSISTYCEVDNRYWETEDCFILKDGYKVEIIYRNYSWIKEQLHRVLIEHQAGCGFSTCFCSNLLTSKVLYEDDEKFTRLQKEYSFPYPERLKENIIAKNMPLLKDISSSYYNQIKVAVDRDDRISINHRVSAFLESYFDILFAINKIYHPGEKKLLQIVKRDCSKIPDNFENDIETLLKLNPDNVLDIIDSLIVNLEKIV